MLFEADKVMFEIYRETEYTGQYRVCYFTELQDHNKESEINHALAGEHFFDGFIKNFRKDEAKVIIASLLVGAFGPHLEIARHPDIVGRAAERVRTAEDILGRANMLLDLAPAYSEEVVEACVAAFQAVNGVFAEERAGAEQSGGRGEM